MPPEPYPGSTDPLVSLVRPINSQEDYERRPGMGHEGRVQQLPHHPPPHRWQLRHPEGHHAPQPGHADCQPALHRPLQHQQDRCHHLRLSRPRHQQSRPPHLHPRPDVEVQRGPLEVSRTWCRRQAESKNVTQNNKNNLRNEKSIIAIRSAVQRNYWMGTGCK